MKEKVTISIERSLLERIDETRGLVPRSAWIEDYLKTDSRVMIADAGTT